MLGYGGQFHELDCTIHIQMLTRLQQLTTSRVNIIRQERRATVEHIIFSSYLTISPLWAIHPPTHPFMTLVKKRVCTKYSV